MEIIGLVTFSSAYDNYGQVLQAFAIQEYLNTRGHKVVLLRKNKTTFDSLIFYLKIIIKKLLILVTGSKRMKRSFDNQMEMLYKTRNALRKEKLHPRHFEEFRQHYFKTISSNSSSLRSHHLTVLCSGSDQIWSWQDPFMFLHFGDSDLKRIAIAPSTGNKALTRKGKGLVKKWLGAYSFITVRESSGMKMCHELGYDHVTRVLDPSFLMDREYDHLIVPNYRNGNDYIFVYLLRSETPVSYEEILSFAQINGLKVKYVTGQGRSDDYEKEYATIPEWLSLIRDAKYVITNSFHGMVFSVIFRKKFLVLLRIDKTQAMNERVIELAEQMHLTERIYVDSLSKVMEGLDYSYAENVIRKNKEQLDKLLSEVNL